MISQPLPRDPVAEQSVHVLLSAGRAGNNPAWITASLLHCSYQVLIKGIVVCKASKVYSFPTRNWRQWHFTAPSQEKGRVCWDTARTGTLGWEEAPAPPLHPGMQSLSTVFTWWNSHFSVQSSPTLQQKRAKPFFPLFPIHSHTSIPGALHTNEHQPNEGRGQPARCSSTAAIWLKKRFLIVNKW